MSGRPEILFPLFADLESLPGIGPKTLELNKDRIVLTVLAKKKSAR